MVVPYHHAGNIVDILYNHIHQSLALSKQTKKVNKGAKLIHEHSRHFVNEKYDKITKNLTQTKFQIKVLEGSHFSLLFKPNYAPFPPNQATEEKVQHHPSYPCS